ncbi:hypothetical protein KOR42_04280 [Thalassoglobus neptunius]|uniref:BFN domain-containing protein n=1 Tax=Thalassoglobus neptunius TaxID=1938619 RepID=A0A5C5X2K7_9PLAN|nr:bifunctional nuclease family protein [Thalassoglobus neptunius]TWT57070.1 hypothetical protein KOR42_04280 [Thalassoglobus neptunius]
MLIQMELARIIISELTDQQMVYLREVDSENSEHRYFPIVIGIFEATSIDRSVQGHVPQRPLTHDLLKSVIEEMGGELEDIVITNLVEHTYYAVLRIRHQGEIVEIDSRPSDAIALAAHYDPPKPIFVDEAVLDAAIG